MPLDVTPTSQLSRRRFLTMGIGGAAALVCARWLYSRDEAPDASAKAWEWLDGRRSTIIAAIVPVMLAGALPEHAREGARAATARAEVIAGIDRAIAGLPPSVRDEIGDLFALLAFAPARCLLAGVWSPWERASPDEVANFLARWHGSRFALLRSAYDALHQITYAAWYGNPRSWQAIGYAGPPALEAS